MSKKIQMNQNCAEVMLIKAAQLVMNQNLNFQYANDIPDEQVDLGPAFMASPDEQKQVWYSGKKQETLEADLNGLYINKVYFLRTGANGGAGHWQNLFFDDQKNGWMVYSNEVNNYQLTANNKLTEQGKNILATHANWGPANGQYAFLIVEASEQNLINGANYLYDFRTLGADAAMNNAFAPKDDFYQQIKGSADARINQEANNLQNALEAPKQEFEKLLEELKSIHEVLEDKLKNNSKYEKITTAVGELSDTLKQQKGAFFENPSPESFKQFKEKCEEKIKLVEDEAKNDRGNPVMRGLLGVLKGFVGIIAAITVIPALVLVIQFQSTRGFKQTFFGAPETNTSLKVADFKKQYEAQVKEIDKGMEASQFEI